MSGYKEVIPAALTPTHIDYLKAKSDDYGGDTLAEHTWAVLCRLSDQYRLRPQLAEQVGDARLWHRLYWGCFLHDFGKAATQFQERLKDTKVENEWRAYKHRHEVLSLGFVDWLFPPGHVDRTAVICVIAAHHKDYHDIEAQYGTGDRTETQQEFINFLADQIDSTVADDLWRWLVEYGHPWQEALGFPILEPVTPINREAFGRKTITQALDEFIVVGSDYELAFTSPTIQDFLYRGLILTADHAASAGADAFPSMQLDREIAIRPIGNRTLRYHQQQADQSGNGSTIMIAPTGSGKTEAAMLWAAAQHKQRPVSRLFYTLPYQASMNAMADRLSKKFYGVEFASKHNNMVIIQHSRATLKFYQDQMEADSGTNPKEAVDKARQRRNLSGLNYFPIQVFSPYQMLKAAYSLKGYEPLLVDYTNALFIFDEIHAYDPSRLALIITMMGWLTEHYGARFLVMTATLPPTVKQAMDEALPGCELIEANEATFTESRRHEVKLRDGNLLHSLDDVVRQYTQGNSVLVCCNRVDRAQDAYKQLKEGLTQTIPGDDIRLLHGRFNGHDRAEKEAWLMQRVGTGMKRSERQPTVFVATQVVEVSLDVDFDVLYTDPAPLEALLQRFGRVNRGRDENAPLCDVHVFREPLGEKESLPYDHKHVARGLEILKAGPIDEAMVSGMLEQVYSGEIADAWWDEYRKKAYQFERILASMKPYQSASPETAKRFYDLFDGQQILPFDCAEAYDEAKEKGGYLAASEYLVNIPSWRWAQLVKLGRSEPYEDNDDIYCTTIRYSPEWGLDFSELSQHKDDDV